MVSWYSTPWAGVFGPSTGLPWPGLGGGLKVFYASPGSVDAQGITRTQVAIPQEAQTDHSLVDASRTFNFGAVNFTGADFAANSGKWLTVSLFVAPANLFPPGGNPTPAQILALGTSLQVFRSAFLFNTVLPDGRLDYEFGIQGPFPQNLASNTKYWFLILPTVVTSAASTPSVANDKPMPGIVVNTMGRAISLWTNRSPGAPIITSPANGASVAPNSTFALGFSSGDPDAFTGGSDSFYTDIAGAQVQYASVATPSNPTPTWSDLPIANSGGTALGPGWAIKKSTVIPSDAGAWNLLDGGTVLVRCGSNNIFPNQGSLPSGDWQIRVRTFDYGHQMPRYYNPLNRDASLLSPNAYFSGNTSPWSTPVTVTVPARVPPAIPISPRDGFARPAGDAVTLVWQYRNAAVPLTPSTLSSGVSTGALALLPVAALPVAWPSGTQVKLANGQIATLSANAALGSTLVSVTLMVISSAMASGSAVTPQPYKQAGRLVQIRKSGETAWTTLANDTSSDNSLLVSGYVLEATTLYEWRVQTRDVSETANFSEIARFWVVPAPSSGDVRPIPTDTIDGATLGVGQHRVFVYRRGGLDRVGELRSLSHVDWSRVRDDISTSQIEVSGWDQNEGALLSSLQTWAYEIVIFRNNGYTVDRVWEGPITLLTYEVDKVTIDAKDVMAYPYRRIIKQAMNDAGVGDTVTSRAARIIQNVMAPDDPNILAYLTVLSRDDDAMEYRSTPAYSRTAFEEIDDMASNAGLDYTAVGRSILLWGTKHRIGTLPEFKDKDFGAPPIVSEYGMSAANVYSVGDGSGVHGDADRLGVSGEDPIYGLIEMLSSSWASDSADSTGSYTQEGLDKMQQSFAEFAERSISDRFPPPVVVRVPDNTSLSPDAVISIQQLVPGVAVPLRSTGTLRPVVATQKLDSLKVVEDSGKETITVTLSPFSRDDTGTEDTEATE